MVCGLKMENRKIKNVCPVDLTCVERAVRGTEHNNIRVECRKTTYPTPPVVPTMFGKPETRESLVVT